MEPHDQEPFPSTPPQLEITIASPRGSGGSLRGTPIPQPATHQQENHEPLSPVDSPGEDPESLGNLLHNCRFHERPDRTGKRFWTLPVLQRVVTSQAALGALESGGVQKHKAEQIAKTILQPPEPGKASYIKVFCILELCDKMGIIEDFICPESGVCDDDLPLESISTKKGTLELRKRSKQRLPCFKKWKPGSLESFERYQYEFCPHIFNITDNTKAPHFDLHSEIILPFAFPRDELRGPLPSDDRIGAFGEVLKYHIPPECHGFDKIVTKLHLKEERGVFAVKKLHRGKVDDWKLFKHETDQLQRFNGRTSPHIITLLATFSQDGGCYFVFPFAEADLCKYWETRSPPGNWEFTRWYADQLSGLIDAIFSIHFPDSSGFLQPDQPKFGRHGDIKPDNILWFKSTSHAQGLFVVSDLGLSALNSDKSKSNIPGENVPPVPGYRPPECDIEQAKVSRLFDVWTMGCLYLEMITWYLGGEELRMEFEKQRTTTFLITGAQTTQFYNLEVSAEEGGMLVQFVKPEVTNWIHRLRSHEACTDFVHDIIDIIEGDMIVILANPPKRADSRKLKRLFGNVREKCEKSKGYCELPTPRSICTPLSGPKEGVRVRLNKMVKHQMSQQDTGSPTQTVFKGKELGSARPEQYQDAE